MFGQCDFKMRYRPSYWLKLWRDGFHGYSITDYVHRLHLSCVQHSGNLVQRRSPRVVDGWTLHRDAFLRSHGTCARAGRGLKIELLKLRAEQWTGRAWKSSHPNGSNRPDRKMNDPDRFTDALVTVRLEFHPSPPTPVNVQRVYNFYTCHRRTSSRHARACALRPLDA